MYAIKPPTWRERRHTVLDEALGALLYSMFAMKVRRPPAQNQPYG